MTILQKYITQNNQKAATMSKLTLIHDIIDFNLDLVPIRCFLEQLVPTSLSKCYL